MATVTSIAQAIATQMDALPFVDKASSTEYISAATGVKTCAAFVIPYDQETRAEYSSFGDTVTLKHTLTVEFWCPMNTAQPSGAFTVARDAGYYAIVKLLANDGTGYTLDRTIGFVERVNPEPVTVANVPWIVSMLRVPVENEVTF
jgi:hypothetical protein